MASAKPIPHLPPMHRPPHINVQESRPLTPISHSYFATNSTTASHPPYDVAHDLDTLSSTVTDPSTITMLDSPVLINSSLLAEVPNGIAEVVTPDRHLVVTEKVCTGKPPKYQTYQSTKKTPNRHSDLSRAPTSTPAPSFPPNTSQRIPVSLPGNGPQIKHPSQTPTHPSPLLSTFGTQRIRPPQTPTNSSPLLSAFSAYRIPPPQTPRSSFDPLRAKSTAQTSARSSLAHRASTPSSSQLKSTSSPFPLDHLSLQEKKRYEHPASPSSFFLSFFLSFCLFVSLYDFFILLLFFFLVSPPYRH